jgi:hypothetical protein
MTVTSSDPAFGRDCIEKHTILGFSIHFIEKSYRIFK